MTQESKDPMAQQQVGPPRVVSIHIALASRLPMKSVEAVAMNAGKGIPDDRYENSRHRHLTIQSQTSLDEASLALGAPIDASATRRNITISSGLVPSQAGDRIRIGEVEVEVVRIAAPCKLLDDDIVAGARTALRRRAGSVCRVLGGGSIRLGDVVDLQVIADK